jgi:filamentous hemagglutinin
VSATIKTLLTASTLTPTQLSIGGTTTLKTAEGDITLIGANIASSGDITIDSARNLLIQSAGESGNGANTFNNQAIGKVYISDTERFSGYHTEKHKDNGADTLQISSNVASLGGSVNLTAANAFSQNGSNVMALEDINVNAKSIEIDNSYNTGYFYSDDKTLKIGAFARVGSPILDLVQTVEAAEASDGRLQTMQSMAAAANVYKVASAIPGSGGSGALVFAEAGVGIKGSNASETATYTTAQTGSITAGENLTLTTTEGDIRIKGSSLAAGDTLTLDSANDIYLEAAKSTEHSDAKHSNYGIEVGVGASYGAQTGVYVYVGIQAGGGKSYFDGTTYENALLLADTLNLSANRDITLKGGEAHAETINVNAGENLTIESLQESEYGKESESGMNLKVQVSFGTAWEIKDKGGNGGINSAKANGEYLGVNQQSGLFAGDGGYHVNVGENTNLVGGAIASTNPSNSTLTTETLSLTHLQNTSSYDAMTAGISSDGSNFSPSPLQHEQKSDTSITYATITDGTITVGGVTTNSAESLGAHTDLATAHTALEKLPDLKQLLADQQAMAAAASTIISVSNQIASDIAGNAEKTKDNLKNEFGNTLSPEDQQIYNSLTPTQKESVLLQNADATTIAAYNDAQTTISHWGVGGDYSRALGVVTNIIVGVTAGQTSTQLTANAVAPYAAELIGNTFDHTDDPNQVAQLLSHAVLGGVLAYANGGNAASGALAGAGAEAASLYIAKELYPDAFDADGTFHRDRLSEGQANAILALSGAVGAFVGGVSGGGIQDAVIDANVAQNAVENNRLLSKEEKGLNNTKEANLLKEVLAEKYPNIGKENIDKIFEQTQKGMVNAMDEYVMNLQINTTANQANKDDIQFIVQEAKEYFTEAAKGNVYLDRTTQTLVPMMDKNNFNDSTYNPSSNSAIVKSSVVSYGLTAAGMVPNPFVAIPAWVIDTGRGTLTNDYSNGWESTFQNLAPNYIGNPWLPKIYQQAGAAASTFNTTQSIANYNDKIKQLEQQRDKTNTLKPVVDKPKQIISKPLVDKTNFITIPKN